MAKCVQCGKGGAKRQCPALNGSLCPACCAQDQRDKIACPDECGFLRRDGGKSGYSTAVPKLIDYVLKKAAQAGPALTKLAGPAKTLADWEEQLATAYAAYGYADATGDRAIDVFLREGPSLLKASEVEALHALQQTAWPSVFEVQKVDIDHGLHFKDLITGLEIFVHEKSATHALEKFDVVLGWVMRLGERFELTGACVGVPRMHLDAVLKALTKEVRRLRRTTTDAPDQVLLREAIVSAQQALRSAFENWQPPKMVTMDGEEVIFCTALFDIIDLEAVHAKLRSHPDMDEGDDGFDWVDRKGRTQLGDGSLHLGSIRIERDRLRLETNSRERLERGKQMLVANLAGAARHRIDSIKDLNVAMEEYSERPQREPTNAIPEDVQAQIIGPLMQKHIDSWIDECVPALGGKTPRQVAKTKAGRTKVLAMLKDQENSMQRQPGAKLVDFSWVYKELGLDKQ